MCEKCRGTGFLSARSRKLGNGICFTCQGRVTLPGARESAAIKGLWVVEAANAPVRFIRRGATVARIEATGALAVVEGAFNPFDDADTRVLRAIKAYHQAFTRRQAGA